VCSLSHYERNEVELNQVTLRWCKGLNSGINHITECVETEFSLVKYMIIVCGRTRNSEDRRSANVDKIIFLLFFYRFRSRISGFTLC
jgi:hypothetical protein